MPEMMDTPAEPPEEPTILDVNGTTANQPEDLSPVHQPAPLLPGPQPAQTILTARQTHSGRVVRNTPCYEQSMNQCNQGLVASEVLLDQDDREDIPMAESQYAIHFRRHSSDATNKRTDVCIRCMFVCSRDARHG